MCFPRLKPFSHSMTCICGLDECKSITTQFRAIQDARGQLQTLPNLLVNSRKTKANECIAFYGKRIRVHRPLVTNALDTQIKEKTVRATRESQDKRQEVYVATWHFDKRVLSSLEDGFSTVQREMPMSEARAKGIYHAKGGSCYTEADVYEKDINSTRKKKPQLEKYIVLVPTFFNIQEAQCDIETARPFSEANVIIEQTAKKRHPSVPVRTLPAEQLSPKRKKTKGPFLEMKDINDIISMSTKAKRTYLQKLADDIDDYKESHDLEVWDLKQTLKVQVGDLLSYEAVLGAAKIREEEIEKRHDTLKEQYELNKSNMSLEQHLRAMKDAGGLNRISLTSKDGICANSKICAQLYGFDDFEFLIEFLEAAFDIKYLEAKSSTATNGKGNNLSEFEQCLLALVYTNTIWGYEILGLMFGGLSKKTVALYINRWVPLLGERGDMMSNLLEFMDEGSFEELEPSSYIEVGLRKVAALVDGKDFLAETVRTDRTINCAQASSKMHASAFRILTWSLPCGAVIERTPAFLARASEKNLMRTWGALDRLRFPVGYLILADKGFDNTAACYVNYNTVLHPSFLTNKRFNRDQVNHNVRVCQKRYSCEVVYSRVTQVEKLAGIMKREWFHHCESLIGWAHGRANLCYGHLQQINDTNSVE